jgi:hypothetical protein
MAAEKLAGGELKAAAVALERFRREEANADLAKFTLKIRNKGGSSGL